MILLTSYIQGWISPARYPVMQIAIGRSSMVKSTQNTIENAHDNSPILSSNLQLSLELKPPCLGYIHTLPFKSTKTTFLESSIASSQTGLQAKGTQAPRTGQRSCILRYPGSFY